jgi:hypothetical protein
LNSEPVFDKALVRASARARDNKRPNRIRKNFVFQEWNAIDLYPQVSCPVFSAKLIYEILP